MRIEQLTFTRFVAAVSIVIFHYGRSVFPFNQQSVSFIFNQANVSVSYFFILSGFIMIIAYGNKSKVDAYEYWKSRFARVYPVYLLALFLMVVFLTIVRTPVDTTALILNVFAIQAWIPGKALSLNPPGWSLTVEFFFYALFPFLFNSFYKKGAYKTLAVPIISVWLVTQFVFHVLLSPKIYNPASENHDLIYYFPLMHLSQFLIGNLAGLFFIHYLKNKTGNYDWALLLTMLAIILLLKYPVGLINYHNGLLALLFVPCILLVSLNNGLVTSICKTKAFILLGEISYSIYILQIPVFSFADGILNHLRIENHIIRFYLSLIALLAASAFSYIAFETPLRKRIQGHSKKVVLLQARV